METDCGDKDKRILGINVEEEDGDDEVLKKRISSHPLFGLLIETHFNCLKVGLSEIGEVGAKTEPGRHRADSKTKNDTILNPSDLDQFMEEYCMALSRLKEGLQKAQEESASFINATYLQLGELMTPNNYL